MVGASGDEGSEPTFYETLGVGEDASAAEIRVAYRERAKDTHPDVSDAPDAGRRFRRVKRAHEVLTDEPERRRYDRLGHEAYLALDDDASRNRGPADPAESRTTGGGASEAGTSGAGASETGGSDGGSTSTGSGERAAGADANDGRTGRSAASANAGASRGDRSRSRRRGRRGAGGGSGGGGHPSRGGGAGEPVVEGGTFGRAAYGLARWLELAGALVDTWQSRLGPAGAAVALATFAAYPVLLASTVTPLFPLPVNLLVGLCTLAVLGYLVVRPAVGVAVLGTWLLVLPVFLTVSGIGVFSLGGFYALVLTGVPLVLCIATLAGVSV